MGDALLSAFGKLAVGLVLIPSLAFARNPALVIIDMQPLFSERYGFHQLPGNQPKIDQVLERQIELIRLAKEQNVPILLVEFLKSGPTSKALTDEIGAYPNARVFTKWTDSLFDPETDEAKRVAEHLDALKVTDLIVVGANGGACVKCSIEGALKAGYRVWTDPHAIVDFNDANFIYPYHYRDGQLRARAEIRANLRQRPKITSFDEILGGTEVDRNPKENCVNGALAGLLGGS